MVYVATGVLLSAIFIIWAIYKVFIRKDKDYNDIIAGLFFVVIFFLVLYFLIAIA